VLNREIPFLRITIPLCAGILSGLILSPGQDLILIIAAIICTGFLLSIFFNKNQTNIFFGIFITIAFYVSGLLLYKFEKNSLSSLEESPGTYSGIITGYPEEKTNSFKLIIKLTAAISGQGRNPVKGSVLIYLDKDPAVNRFLPGDRIKIRITPRPVVNRGNPGEFDYRFFMENHGIRYFAYAGPNDLTGHYHPDKTKLRYRALIIREKILNMYRESGISEDRLALVAAMTLGQKNLLDPEQKEAFMRAGVMHIMAVSGLHAMILSFFISNLLFFLKGRLKPMRVLITVLLLWAFAFVTGLTPSVMRAALMFSFLETGKLIRRNVNNVNTVLASAFILIMIRPSVIFDAGFLLSYSAVIFIIVFYRKFYSIICCKTYITDKIWQSVTVTIIAQAGTLPLTISLFNRFPVWFIFSNLIIVPLSSVLIILGCLIPATYPVRFISESLAYLLDHLAGFIENLTRSVSLLPVSSIENIGMAGIEPFLLFLAIFSSALWLAERRKIKITIPLLSFLAWQCSGTIHDIGQKSTRELIVYNTPKNTSLAIRSGRSLYLYSSGTDLPDDVLRHCARDRLKIRQVINTENIRKICVGEKKILICNNLNHKTLTEFRPDFLVLTGSYPSVEKRCITADIKEIIISSEVSSYYKLPENIKNRNSNVHLVSQRGAFISGL
jgi:competence protein ComEC